MYTLLAAMTIEDTMILGAMIGGIIGFFMTLIKLGDRLWKNNAEKNNRVDQSLECNVQHESLKHLISNQLEQIKIQNESIKEMINSFRTMTENTKLQHEIVMNSLKNSEKSEDSLHKKVDRLHDRLDYAKVMRYSEVPRHPEDV
jgi:methyl-accepting chemotaxis protein